METATQELTIIDRSIETIKGGTEILSANKTSVIKANDAASALIEKIKANDAKLTPELDNAAMELLVKINKTLKVMNERRSPITQLLTLISSEFTSLENDVDPKKPNTPASILQQYRNIYAQELAVEEKRKNQEAADKAAKNQEQINIKAEAQNRLNSYFYNYLTIEKAKLNDMFNTTTIETYDGHKSSIMGLQVAYSYNHFLQFNHGLYATKYHNIQEINAFVKVHMESFFSGLAEIYKKEMSELQAALLEKLPSKKAELEEIAAAGAAQKQRLLEEQKQREEADAARVKLENEALLSKANQEVESTKIADTTMNLFQQETDMQLKQAAPETRTGYEIEVTNTAGWMLIFQFWFTNEGKGLTIEDAGKKSLNQMKAFCEKYSHKHSTRIESPFIKYTETYKAVNRKA